MTVGFDVFMLGLELLICQAALHGLFALWLASRRHRLARVIGGLIVSVLVWTSFVPIINRLGGYPMHPDMDICLSTIAALLLGWIAGRNRRLRNLTAQPENPRGSRLIFDGTVQSIGLLSLGLTGLSVVLTQLIGFFAVLSIVSDMAGYWGVVVGVIFAPVTILIGPLWIGYQWHNWMPAALCYGSVVTMCLEGWFGQLVGAPKVD